MRKYLRARELAPASALAHARDLKLLLGALPPGTYNAITDVPGVLVGHKTLISGDGPLVPGDGPVRTGVTAILPHGGNLFREKVAAAVYTINGFGKAAGFEQVREMGTIETPILLTNTLSVGIAVDACISYMLEQNPDIGITAGSVNPVVGECNDGYLNDLRGRHVRAEHVLEAIRSAHGGPVEEGSVGAGTGTSVFGYKGGIGSASRRTPDSAGGFMLGVLVQTNFGRKEDLLLDRKILEPAPAGPAPEGDGSIMIVIATDAPCDSRQLERLARRAPYGLGRVGSLGASGSGDFAIAFSTTNRSYLQPAALLVERTRIEDEAGVLNPLFQAVIEAVAEAVLNAMLAAETMTGRDGNTLEGFSRQAG